MLPIVFGDDHEFEAAIITVASGDSVRIEGLDSSRLVTCAGHAFIHTRVGGTVAQPRLTVRTALPSLGRLAALRSAE